MADSGKDDWRYQCIGIVAVLDKARKEARFTDIQFVMGPGTSKKEFQAHKTILACGSPVFEKMFYGALAEKRSVIDTDDDPEAFEMLLNYIYGKSNTITSLTSAWKYFTIGDKYLVPKIQDAAKEYINSIALTEDAFWDIIKNNIFSSPLFLEKFNSYMVENTRKVIESKKFLTAPKVIVEYLVQMDKLGTQEYQLLLAVTKWGYENTQYNSEDMLQFYKYIRFSTLTSNEFFQFIDYYPKAIDAQSNLEILHHLHSPYDHKLPKWCSTSKVSRFLAYEQQHCMNMASGNTRYSFGNYNFGNW